jgi:hypothetical protein
MHWIKRFILVHNKTHPLEFSETHISAFLSYLAINKSVFASTQNVALNTIAFLYKKVLGVKLGDFSTMNRAKEKERQTGHQLG